MSLAIASSLPAVWIDVYKRQGDDWEGKFDELKAYCEVVYLPRTEGISTTKIKEDLEKLK